MSPRRRTPGNPGSVEYPATLPRGPVARRAIYARLSDGNDEDTISVSDQLAQCQAFCTKHGYVVTAIYTDIATGKNPKRTYYQQMMADARVDKFDGIVFYVGDRLYRGLVGAGPVIDLHADRPRIVFEAVAENFDIEYVGIWATMSGKELESIRRRTMGQRQSRARDYGQLMASWSPYWITRDEATKKPILDPERAPWVLRAIERYMAGDSSEDIRTMLRDAAPANRRAGTRKPLNGEADCQWTQSTLTQLLKHPALYGELPYSWRESEPVELPDGYVVQRITKNDRKRIMVPVPPLLHRSRLERAECAGCELDSRPSFDELREMAQKRQVRLSSGHPATHAYPLRRRVRCAGCGGFLSAQTQTHWQAKDKRTGKVYKAEMKTPKVNLLCQGMRREDRTKRTCRRTIIANGSAIWRDVRTEIERIASDPASVDAVASAIRAAIESAGEALKYDATRVDKITDELAALDMQEARTIRRRDREEISEAAYKLVLQEIAYERQALQAEKVAILQHRTLAQEVDEAESDLRAGFALVAQLSESRPLTDTEWARLLSHLVEYVDLNYDNEPVIRWRGQVANTPVDAREATL